MRAHTPLERLSVVVAVVALLAGCQQVDQVLPFELDGDESATATIGSNGGVVSVPPSFSMRFPAGAYSGQVSVTRRIDSPFPSDAGLPVPGTAFDVGPPGTVLAVPARVELAVASELLQAGDEVRAGVALLRSDLSVATFDANYDVTNGILSANVDELGPVAAVVLADAIPVSLASPPALGGGSFAGPGPAPPGPSAVDFGGVHFTATCSPAARRCFSSGIVRVWADDIIRERLGEVLYLVDAEVEADLEFYNFVNNVPQAVVGWFRLGGDLRARINSVVTQDRVDEIESTGFGPGVTPTSVTFQGATMVLAETSEDVDKPFDYGVSGIGTSELLTLEVEAEVTFNNDDGTTDTGIVIAHLRMRR